MHAMGNPVSVVFVFVSVFEVSKKKIDEKLFLPFLQAVCITAAVLTQYFLLAAFCWMLVEGIYFYLFIVKVYNISNKMIVYHVMAWGILL